MDLGCRLKVRACGHSTPKTLHSYGSESSTMQGAEIPGTQIRGLGSTSLCSLFGTFSTVHRHAINGRNSITISLYPFGALSHPLRIEGILTRSFYPWYGGLSRKLARHLCRADPILSFANKLGLGLRLRVWI